MERSIRGHDFPKLATRHLKPRLSSLETTSPLTTHNRPKCFWAVDHTGTDNQTQNNLKNMQNTTKKTTVCVSIS